MMDVLHSMIVRSREEVPVVRPRLPGRFEQPAGQPAWGTEVVEERPVEPPPAHSDAKDSKEPDRKTRPFAPPPLEARPSRPPAEAGPTQGPLPSTPVAPIPGRPSKGALKVPSAAPRAESVESVPQPSRREEPTPRMPSLAQLKAELEKIRPSMISEAPSPGRDSRPGTPGEPDSTPSVSARRREAVLLPRARRVAPAAASTAEPASRKEKETPSGPQIEVRIGRIEVRPADTAAPKAPRPAPRMPLNQYLAKRPRG